MSDPVDAYWKDMPHKQSGCVGCGVTEHFAVGVPLWKCFVCHAPVCCKCTKTIGDRGKEYHDQTLCSRKCWEAAGCPED